MHTPAILRISRPARQVRSCPTTICHQARKTALRTFALLLTIAATSTVAHAQAAGIYQTTNIISDGFVTANFTDPAFINPWGVSGGKTLWIDTANTGFSYVLPITGNPISFKAIVPPASGTGVGTPTGTIQNTTTAGFILSNGSKSSFLFATLDGTISGWNGAQSAGGNHALIMINNSANNAVYTDLALLNNTTGSFLLAPNFGQGGKVEIYDTTFKSATLAGTFTDPNVPAGYAPYSIKVLGTQVFVSYTLRTTPPFTPGTGTYQEILGTNTGFVSVFDLNGNFVARAVTGGNLNAPWGIAIAPTGFGIFGGDLLIGNFGDGLITAYNPTTYAYLGTVADGTGKPIAFPGLWDIFFTTATGDPNTLYFTAGLAHETHGLFGSIANTSTTTAAQTFNLSSSSKVASVAAGSSATVTISIAPTNAFTGAVTLDCKGLPLGATCSFSANPVSVTPTTPAISTLTIKTAAATASLRSLPHRTAIGIAYALVLPFGFLFASPRRKRAIRLSTTGLLVLLFAASSLMVGCAYTPPAPVTPAGTSNVTVSATAGSVTQTTVVALTVK